MTINMHTKFDIGQIVLCWNNVQVKKLNLYILRIKILKQTLNKWNVFIIIKTKVCIINHLKNHFKKKIKMS